MASRLALAGIALLAACATARPHVVSQAAGLYGPNPGVILAPIEQQAVNAVRRRFGRAVEAPALVLAARDLAARAAEGDARPLERPKLRSALAAGLSFDPAPVAHLVEAPIERVVEALTDTISPASTSHVGAGLAVRGRTAYLVLLTAWRTLSLKPFPREVDPDSIHVVHGQLLGLSDPKVFLTFPSGEVREIRASGRTSFSAEIRFGGRGRYLLEIMGTGPSGPEVAGLLSISCGGVPLDAAAFQPVAKPSRGTAEEQIVAAINATRGRHAVSPLTANDALSDVARRHSANMLSRGQLAHVLPGSGDVGERLRSARFPFRRVLENVAKGPTPLEAHLAAEESPAHRSAMLDPLVTEVGCGIAQGRLPTGDPVVYLTEIFVQPIDDASGSRLSPEARIMEVIWRERARFTKSSLLSDPILDRLAREAAHEMLRRGDPAKANTAERALALGRKLSSSDAFIATTPAAVAQSRNLADPRFKRVGVGVAIGDHPRYGSGLLWIAVLYSD